MALHLRVRITVTVKFQLSRGCPFAGCVIIPMRDNDIRVPMEPVRTAERGALLTTLKCLPPMCGLARSSFYELEFAVGSFEVSVDIRRPLLTHVATSHTRLSRTSLWRNLRYQRPSYRTRNPRRGGFLMSPDQSNSSHLVSLNSGSRPAAFPQSSEFSNAIRCSASVPGPPSCGIRLDHSRCHLFGA